MRILNDRVISIEQTIMRGEPERPLWILRTHGRTYSLVFYGFTVRVYRKNILHLMSNKEPLYPHLAYNRTYEQLQDIMSEGLIATVRGKRALMEHSKIDVQPHGNVV